MLFSQASGRPAAYRALSAARDTIFSDTYRTTSLAVMRGVSVAMPTKKPKTAGKPKQRGDRPLSRPAGQSPRPKPPAKRSRRPPAAAGEIVRKRAEVEAAIAEARKSHERLREAIDILPQGIVFLDAEGRYILWNKKYAEIYSRSSDLFKPGARLEDTIRVGVARGDYPEAVGREEEWIAERLKKLYQPGERHEQTLADGRVILIEERLTEDGGIIGLRVDITELKQREASFRLLFDSNPVPMIVCALDDERILARQRRRDPALRLQPRRIREADDPQPAGLRHRTAVDRRPHRRRAGGAHLEACPGRRHADRPRDLFAPARLWRPAGGAAGADGHHRAQARRGAAGLHGPA